MHTSPPMTPFQSPSPCENLRERVHAQLRDGNTSLPPPAEQASEAMRVLHELAAAPETAPSALSLLHELQVHQVELALQADTLQAAHDELASALARQMQLYDCAPTAYLTIGPDTRVWDANLTAAHSLGLERQALIGHRLDGWVASPHALHSLMGRITQGEPLAAGLLRMGSSPAPTRTVCASLSADPAGERFLVTLTTLPEA